MRDVGGFGKEKVRNDGGDGVSGSAEADDHARGACNVHASVGRTPAESSVDPARLGATATPTR